MAISPSRCWRSMPTVGTDDGDLPIETFLANRDGSRAIVTSVGFTLPAEGSFRFLKVSTGQAEGRLGAEHRAQCWNRLRDGTVSSARIALGCMADRPMRAKAAEKALVGRTLDQGRHRAGVGCRRRRHVAHHRSDRQRLVSQRSPAGPSRPAAAALAAASADAKRAGRMTDGRRFRSSSRSTARKRRSSSRAARRCCNALRDKIGDTSPKGGCHQGTCGACSVIIDGELRLSCLTLAETCNGAVDRDHMRVLRKVAYCIRCSAPSSTASPPNAASARPA